MSKPKYKVGDQKVLVVDFIGHYDDDHRYKDRQIGDELMPDGSEEFHTIYLTCNESDRLEVGELIAAECVKIAEDLDQQRWSSWKRINDE